MWEVMNMNVHISSQVKYFLFGTSLSVLILVSFFFGAIADRVFVIKPLDALMGTRSHLFSLPFNQNTQQSSSSSPTVLNAQEKPIVDVAEKASASVVTVSIKKPQSSNSGTDPFGTGDFFNFGFPFAPMSPQNSPQNPQQKSDQAPQDIGSGFVVDPSGLVVTNKHVVSDANAEYYVIDANDKQHKVSKIYRDPSNDLAILKVDDFNAPAIDLGDSDHLKAGQSVIAIGTALGEFRHTVTTGVVSGLGRGIEAGDPFGMATESLENVIQTDAAINPGNSGGPLLDSSGRVIGVNVAVSESGQNIGFAIPINVIKASLQNFNQTGQFDRPMFGVRYRMISQQAALMNEVPQGAYIMEVVANSSAAAAGLKVGDIISEFDGKSLKDNDLAKLINDKKIGDKVKLKFWRKDKQQEVEAVLKGQS
jgi:serine protease Do